MNAFTKQTADLPDYHDLKQLQSYRNRLERSVYEENLYIIDGNQNISFRIYRRVEGSYYFTFRTSFGKSDDYKALQRNFALNAIDCLATDEHDLHYSLPSHRPIRPNATTHSSELAIEELDLQTGHNLMLKLLKQHEIPLDKFHSWHMRFNDWHGLVSCDNILMKMQDEIPAAINKDYGDKTCWLDLARRDPLTRERKSYLKSFEFKHDLDYLLENFWQFAEEVYKGQAEDYLADTSKGDARMARLLKAGSSLEKKMKEEEEENKPTEAELKARQAFRNRRSVMHDLSRAYAADVDIRELLENDPRFTPDQIDQIIVEMGAEGLFFNEMVGKLSGELSKIIKPLEDAKAKKEQEEKDQANEDESTN